MCNRNLLNQFPFEHILVFFIGATHVVQILLKSGRITCYSSLLCRHYLGLSRHGESKFASGQEADVAAPFNNMRTLTFKAQPTNAFFATVNQVFGDSSQLPTTVERAVIKSLSWLSTVQITKECSAVVGSQEEPPNT